MTARAPRGFILATTLLVMTLLTVMLVAAFIMVSAEFRTTNSSYSTSRSLNLAQAGLQSYLANAHSLSTGSDSTNYGFPGGYARVVAKRLRDSTSSERQLWIVYSTGVDSTRSIIVNGTGTRVVAQLAYLSAGTLPTRAAMVAVNGVQMTGSGPNPINGISAPYGGCTMPGGSAADTTGLTIPKGGYQSGSGAAPTKGIDSLANATSVINSTRIDWARLVAGEFTPDDYNTWPATSDTSHTHYFTGDATIPAGSHKGVLVVKGNLNFATSGSPHWDGIVVVGGNLDTPSGGSATYTIHGILITGLNIALGGTVAKNQINRGNSSNTNAIIRWDWCYTRNSMAALSYLVPVRGTYVDAWKTY